jgi:hypothetical protein
MTSNDTALLSLNRLPFETNPAFSFLALQLTNQPSVDRSTSATAALSVPTSEVRPANELFPFFFEWILVISVESSTPWVYA